MLTLLAQAPDRGLPAPDAVIYLELLVEDAMARGGFGEERYERVQAPASLKEFCCSPNPAIHRALAHAWNIVLWLGAVSKMRDIQCSGCTKL